ncbi:MAG: hypothetical protein KGI75_02185 [Rhizobiaceae bacterium]|nr:hypothetical protein [Rhizobiaceae bacterium]
MDRKLLTKSMLALAAGAVVTLAALQGANAADRVRVRGTIESLDGDTLKVKTKDGKDLMVMLKSGWGVTGVDKASAADIKAGDFVGIANEPTASGVAGAIEVVIFPAAMKGTGEGDRPWDSKPNSSMTNATVANAVKSVNGPTLTLTYKGGEKKINIPDGTPVVTLVSATKDDLKAGAGVFITGESSGDGMVSTDRVAVGINGTIPPM